MTQNDLDNGPSRCAHRHRGAGGLRSSSSCASSNGPPTVKANQPLNPQLLSDYATLREGPYLQFNFLVDVDDGTSESFQAGFQECSNIGIEGTVAEYRNSNEKENSSRKITGLNKSTDVTLKRGVIGSLNLYQWLNAIRTVVIRLQSEDHSAIV
jgi:hypothetical protein